MLKAEITAESEEKVQRISEMRRFFRVFLGRGLVIFGMVVTFVFIFIAIFAPIITPYDPYKLGTGDILESPSGEHLLGTDYLGRDVLSRIIYGSQTSLIVGVVVVTVAAIIGMGLGMLAGYYGGLLNAIIMRCIDALMVFPMILLAMVIAALLGGGLWNVVISLSVALMPIYARVMCAQTMSVKEADYIMAEKSIGANNARIMLRHVLINTMPPLIVIMTMMLGSVILAEAGLSFLGIGIEPPIPSWGGMVSDGKDYLLDHPLLSFAPGLAIMLVVFSINMVGDGLRDALDPRLRGTI
ncbi:MAG: ABC transporter permease [Dehalococcoidales bacterium]|nr:ABC transporter permease [Dehalococcoidales bacterium]